MAVRSYFTGFPGSFKADGIKMMEPFSTLPYLKQSFTWGEFWPVKEERIRKLLADGLLEKEAAERIALKGAVGSHVENIQRADGFKGFNKQRISDIIVETNPASYDKEG